MRDALQLGGDQGPNRNDEPVAIGRPISSVITATGRPPSTAINANRHSGIMVACTESPGGQPASTSINANRHRSGSSWGWSRGPSYRTSNHRKGTIRPWRRRVVGLETRSDDFTSDRSTGMNTILGQPDCRGVARRGECDKVPPGRVAGPSDRSLDSPGRGAADRPHRAGTRSRRPARVPVRAGPAWPADPSIHVGVARVLVSRPVPTHRPSVPGPPPRSRLGHCRETTIRSASPWRQPLTTPLAAS